MLWLDFHQQDQLGFSWRTHDKTFSQFADERDLGTIPPLADCHLMIRQVPQSGSNETPFMLNIELSSTTTGGRVSLPSIRYAVDVEQGEKLAYVYAVQRQKNEPRDIPSAQLQKTVNRLLFKLNQGVLSAESQKFKDYYERRNKNALDGSEPYPENISDVSPAAVLSLSVFVALLSREGVLRIKAPAFLPLRWQAHARLGKEEQERIQESTTDKFLRTFRRVAFHFSDITIGEYQKSEDYLCVKLAERLPNVDNPILSAISATSLRL